MLEPNFSLSDSTRKVYIRKLQRLAGEIEESPAPAQDDDDESDEEEPQPAARPARPMTAKTRSSPQTTSQSSPSG